MTGKTWLTGGIMLALLALTGSIAYGDPPPKQGTEPGVVAHLADCTDENCLPPIKPKLVLAAVAVVGPARIPTIHPAVVQPHEPGVISQLAEVPGDHQGGGGSPGIVSNDLGPDNLQAKHTAAMSWLVGDPGYGGPIAVLVALVRPGPQTTPPPAEKLMPRSATLQAAASDADPVPGPPDTPTVRG
jgi:hypothetical protein